MKTTKTELRESKAAREGVTENVLDGVDPEKGYSALPDTTTLIERSTPVYGPQGGFLGRAKGWER